MKKLLIILPALFIALIFGNYMNFFDNKKTLRVPSSVNISSDMQLILDLNSEIINIKSKDQIMPMIYKIRAMAEANPNNQFLILYKALFSPLRNLKGIVWRFRNIVEKSQIAHLFSVSFIRKAYYSDYMYGQHVKAFLDYFVEPNLDKKEFENVAAVQNFLHTSVVADLTDLILAVETIMRNTPADWAFPFDAFLLTGIDKNKQFFSQEKRYEKKVIKSHLNYILSSAHKVLGGIYYVVNYDLNDITAIFRALLKKTGINNSKFNRFFRREDLPKPITSKELSETVLKFKKFLTLRVSKDVANQNLQKSFDHFHKGTHYDLIGLQSVYRDSDLDLAYSYVYNPYKIYLNYDKKVESLETKLAIYKDAAEKQSKLVTSEATGQQIEINLSAFFVAHDDLKKFFPRENNFDDKNSGYILKDSNGKSVYHNITEEKVSVWNYHYGKPLSYPNPTFGGILPKATNANLYDLIRGLRLDDSTNGFANILPVP